MILPSGMSPLAADATTARSPFRKRLDALLAICSGAMALRSLTLLCRFGLTIYAAKEMALSDLGTYGLLTAAVATTVYVLGFQFYVFNLREIASTESAVQHVRQIRDQIVFHAVLYGVVGVALGLVALLFDGGDEGASKWLCWLPVLAVVEHLSQEGYRVLVALSRGNAANLIFFIRSGAWVCAWIGWVAWTGRATFDGLCTFWLAGSGLSVVLSGVALARMPWSEAWCTAVDWAWIRRGVRLGVLYSVIVLSYAVGQYVTRYVLDATHGAAAAGVFFFFVSMASPVMTLVEAGPYALLQPKMLRLHSAGLMAEYREQWRTMAIGVVAGAATLIVGTAVLTALYLKWAGRGELVEGRAIFGWVCAAMFLQCAALVPQAHLFALRADKRILVANIVAMGVAVLASALLIHRWGGVGAGMAHTVSAAVFLVMMIVLAWQAQRRKANG
jgi:O-antigen/teichoic acid export membrane protein